MRTPLIIERLATPKEQEAAIETQRTKTPDNFRHGI
jgi:hypothetical protein